MNAWKPLALISSSAFALLVGYHASFAEPARAKAPDVAGNQPNMEAALSHLKEARTFLDKAEHNKGGWRAKAIESTDVAIRETARGVGFADTH
jgi:hypothetical protein